MYSRSVSLIIYKSGVLVLSTLAKPYIFYRRKAYKTIFLPVLEQKAIIINYFIAALGLGRKSYSINSDNRLIIRFLSANNVSDVNYTINTKEIIASLLSFYITNYSVYVL